MITELFVELNNSNCGLLTINSLRFWKSSGSGNPDPE